MKVRDIALKEVHCAEPGTSMEQIAAMMKRHGIGAVPVCEEKKLLGMLTDRDIVISCVASGADTSSCLAQDFMTASPVFVRPDSTVEEAALVMAKEQIHRLPVVANGELMGMLSLGDLSLALADNDKLVADTVRKISTPI